MREIKFRGKRIWTDEWIYGNLVIDKHGRNHIVPFAYFDEDGHHLSYKDDTDTPVFIMQESVGQFTGLHDKNGKGLQEVWEGDIISEEGLIKGSIHETNERGSDLLIPRMGTKAWNVAYKKAVDRGFDFAE